VYSFGKEEEKENLKEASFMNRALGNSKIPVIP
jgi:hypothetical protein